MRPTTSITPADVADRCRRAVAARHNWQQTPLPQRLAIIRRFRHRLVEHGLEIAAAIRYSPRNNAAETLAAELIPLADACRFLEANASRILQTRYPQQSSGWSRFNPIVAVGSWFSGVHVAITPKPLGLILVVGPSNYPIFLATVPVLQGLVAGNAVLMKPAPGAEAVTTILHRLLLESGLPGELLQLLNADACSVEAAISAGVNKVVLTGSAETGRSVMQLLAETTTPSVMELSGCDAMLVLPGANLDRVAAAIAFGLCFNGSATCIAPRRIIVERSVFEPLCAAIQRRCNELPTQRVLPKPVQQAAGLLQECVSEGGRLLVGSNLNEWHAAAAAGAAPDTLKLAELRPTVVVAASLETGLLHSDLFAPLSTIIAADGEAGCIAAANNCRYQLGCSLFGPVTSARRVSRQLKAGCVVINDCIAPTADPRVAFGGVGASGFGVTRGEEGLLEMTHPQAVVTRRGSWLPHLDPQSANDPELLAAVFRWSHAGRFRDRFAALLQLMAFGFTRRNQHATHRRSTISESTSSQ